MKITREEYERLSPAEKQKIITESTPEELATLTGTAPPEDVDQNTTRTNKPDTNDSPRVQKILDHLNTLLVEGEILEAWAIQRRIFALNHRRILLVVTNNRFIALKRRLLSGFDMSDLRWQDIMSVKTNAGIFGADISIAGSRKSDLAINEFANRELWYDGLRKAQTAQIYRICQSHAQAWREKRRVRELEELRARSGGINISTGPAAIPLQNGGNGADIVTRLQQLKELHDKKLVSDSEFESSKAKR